MKKTYSARAVARAIGESKYGLHAARGHYTRIKGFHNLRCSGARHLITPTTGGSTRDHRWSAFDACRLAVLASLHRRPGPCLSPLERYRLYCDLNCQQMHEAICGQFVMAVIEPCSPTRFLRIDTPWPASITTAVIAVPLHSISARVIGRLNAEVAA